MNFIAWLIVACEILFWVVIGAGFITRYLLKMNKLGLFLLALTPVVDLLLIVITSIDLYRGATATAAHGVAAIYIGVSLAYGKSMIAWADERFQYYVTKQGPKPIKRFGMDFAKHYAKGWGKHVAAFIIGSIILGLMIYLIQDAAKTEALLQVLKLWTLVLGIDFLLTCSYFIWPPAKKVYFLNS